MSWVSLGMGQTSLPLPLNEGMGLSRADISALAQAKSANYCGQFITLRRYGQPVEAISRLYLAGGFANYLDVAKAVGIGFIADFPPERGGSRRQRLH